jgi:DNA-binding FadR family transcriptional regulator
MTDVIERLEIFGGHIRKRETLTTQVVRLVGERIQMGDYPRGSKLPTEKALIDEFGVSRTVVREAIANLKASGLVSTQQGIGAFVLHETAATSFRLDNDSLLIVEEVVKGLELRTGIEAEAAALAALRRTDADITDMELACSDMDAAIAAGTSDIEADMAFHRAIATASQNDHFLKMFNYLGELLIPRTRVQTPKLNGSCVPDYLEWVNTEHRHILDAIKRQNAEDAGKAMRVHLIGSRDRLLKNLGKGQ